ncbi:MAG: hypothetical protein GY953_58650, partial [bacterium]|nr:hypothetical protein [bacterium]
MNTPVILSVSRARAGRCCRVALFLAAALSNWATEVHFSERRIIDDSAGELWSVAPADLDGDGDIDLLAGAISTREVVWWENQGGQPPSWLKHSAGGGLLTPYSVFAADLDGDMHVDILSADCRADTIAWWQNDGNRPPTWTRRDVSTSFDCAIRVIAEDVDGDGDRDVVGASDTGAGGAGDIAWWENDGGSPPSWTHHPIAIGRDLF